LTINNSIKLTIQVQKRALLMLISPHKLARPEHLKMSYVTYILDDIALDVDINVGITRYANKDQTNFDQEHIEQDSSQQNQESVPILFVIITVIQKLSIKNLSASQTGIVPNEEQVVDNTYSDYASMLPHEDCIKTP